MPRVSYLLIKLLTLCELKYGSTCIDLLGSRLSRISIINPMRTRLAYLLTFGCLEYHMAYILLLLGHRSITNTIRGIASLTFVQWWATLEDVGPTLYKCYTNVVCLLGTCLDFLKYTLGHKMSLRTKKCH